MIDMGDLVYEPPRDGLTLWEIGFPDRSAAEFYIPDPDPKYANDFLLNDLNRLVIVISTTEFLINTSKLCIKKLCCMLVCITINSFGVSDWCCKYHYMYGKVVENIKSMLFNTEIFIGFIGLDSMDYGTGIQICILTKI